MTSVALLHPCFWPEVRRGAERIVREHADGLLQQGLAPRLVTSHPHRPSRTVEDGLPITRHWRPPDARLKRRHFDDHVTHLPFTARDLATHDDAIAHAFHHADGAVAAHWGRRTGRPVVLSFMGLPHRQGLANRRGRLELTLRAARGATAVVALSHAAALGFERWLGVEARVIPPGVDLATFTFDLPRRAARPTILCAADPAEPRKRVALLVEAFALLRREVPDARLVLPRSTVRFDAPGVEHRVLDDGMGDTAAMARANQEAWVAVLPSIGEAFGVVLLEALACGTPVVAADREALPEVVGDDHDRIARLFTGDEPRALAQALREALDLAADGTTPARCRTRAEEFSTLRTTDAYLDLYRELGAC